MCVPPAMAPLPSSGQMRRRPVPTARAGYAPPVMARDDRRAACNLPMDRHDPANYKPAPDTCPACYRSGFCARCKGNGKHTVGGTRLLIRCRDCTGSGVCPECDGTGRIKETPDPNSCTSCNGSGFCPWCNGNGRCLVQRQQSKALVNCLHCDGSGACAACEGTGRVLPEAEDD